MNSSSNELNIKYILRDQPRAKLKVICHVSEFKRLSIIKTYYRLSPTCCLQRRFFDSR